MKCAKNTMVMISHTEYVKDKICRLTSPEIVIRGTSICTAFRRPTVSDNQLIAAGISTQNAGMGEFVEFCRWKSVGSALDCDCIPGNHFAVCSVSGDGCVTWFI